MRTTLLAVALLALCSCAGPGAPREVTPQKLAAGSPSEAPQPDAPAAPADQDADGLLDDADQCPLDPEDRDAYLDADGCPEPDNDADGIPDADDKCPTEPETYNGANDEDGCPDKGLVIVEPPPQHARLISFDRRSSKIRAGDEDTLAAVIQVLAQHPEIGRVLVVGYASEDEGTAQQKLALGLKRAAAVIARLVAGGVAAERLVPAGYGDLCGFDGGRDERARQRNRVVDFKILELNGERAGVELACPAAIDAGLVPAVTPERVPE